jgi:hypothetical protein
VLFEKPRAEIAYGFGVALLSALGDGIGTLVDGALQLSGFYARSS